VNDTISKKDLDLLTASEILEEASIIEGFPPLLDSLQCEYKLPFPDESILSNMDWDDFTFLVAKICPDKPPTEYQISENGKIYEVLHEDDGYGIQEANITKELTFFAIRREEKIDYSLEFSALFYKGDLKELELISLEEQNNEDRRKKEAEMISKAEESLKKRLSISIFKLPFYLIFKFLFSISNFITRFLYKSVNIFR